MITRSTDPIVEEFEFDTLASVITESDCFYIRNHFEEPAITLASYRLRVEGAVETQLALSLADVLKLPSYTSTVTLECAGNNRIFLEPPANGVKWGLGGASTATWTGVRLVDVLKLAGVKANAIDVVLEGADSGYVDVPPKPTGSVSYARSLPLAKATDSGVLLAYQMNGKELSRSHGFPLRVIVPGWYAMASVKWLQRIFVSDTPFNGYFQTTDYAYWEEQDGQTVRVPISRALVKASISRPVMNEVIEAKSIYRVFGAAWVGEFNLASVAISTDRGSTWIEAKLLGEPIANAWRLWEFSWQTPSEAKSCTLMARATDDRGNSQALNHDPNRGDYMINHCLPVTVEVR